MGYSYRNNGAIEDFWPDDDENTIYIESSFCLTLQDLLERAQNKWGRIDMSEISIHSEMIHTACLTYDLMDWSDYTDFIIIERKQEEN